MPSKTFNPASSSVQPWAGLPKVLTASFRLPFVESRVQNAFKCAALSLMLVDHVHLVFFHRSLVWLYWLTRLVFPMFMLLAAQNLERHRARPEKYILQLLVFGLLAQPVYFASFGFSQLNVMFTIAVGVALHTLFKWSKTRVDWALRLVFMAGLIFVPFQLEAGWAGVIAVPVFAALMRRGAWWDWLLALVVCWFVVAGTAPWFVAIAALPVWLIGARVSAMAAPPVPAVKPSRWAQLAAYGFYPLHLAVIALVSRLV